MKIDSTHLTSIQPGTAKQSPVIKHPANGDEVFQQALRRQVAGERASTKEGTPEPVISTVEKKVFEDLFPQSATQVRAYQSPAYKPKSQTVMLGRIIDRRG